jgi:cytidine deaminase
MQDKSKLNPADIELIRIAGAHAKERFQQDFISIGGALRTKSGKIYTGINLKYRVRNTSTCAETMAIYAALNDGEDQLDTVVGVKYFPESDSYQVVNGCGWCRQLFSYNTPLNVIIDNSKGGLEVVKAEDLMPYAFL